MGPTGQHDDGRRPTQALEGLTIAFRIHPRVEATLAYSTLGSDTQTEAFTADGQSNLREIRLTSWQLGGRWFLRESGWLPFLSASLATISGQERGRLLLDEQKWQRNKSTLGLRFGAGVDFPAVRFLSVGARVGYTLMDDFAAPIGGRRHYNGADVRLAVTWQLSG